MAFSPQELNQKLARIARRESEPVRYVVALSGGVDSVALLHALSKTERSAATVALHVDHAVHEQSADWVEVARSAAEIAEVGFSVRRTEVRARGQGLEAAAREARYAVFEDFLRPGDWLLTAHHQEDQAETFLLHALRGSGARGLAAMAEIRSCGAGHVVRPLLDVSRADLRAYATHENLRWVDDPGNDDLSFDRNFLRHEVMPLLKDRWPAAAERLAESARLSRGASALLDELAAIDLERLGSPSRIDVPLLSALSEERQVNVIRHALRVSGMPAAPASALRRVVGELLPAREDAQPLVTWSGGEARRYRDGLYLLRSEHGGPSPIGRLRPECEASLGGGRGSLRLVSSARGLPADMARDGLDVRYRQGGERLRPQRGGRSRKLKTLLQEAGVVPWMRTRIPLLFYRGELVAVADLWVDQDVLADNGYVVEWLNRPALY